MKKLLFSLVFVLMFFLLGCSGEKSKWSDPVSGKTFTEAVIYCSKLKEDGVSGWQLPTTDELSGFDESSGYYWSSDATLDLNKNKEYASDEDKAWFYDFSAKKKNKAFISTRMKVVCYWNAARQQSLEKSQKDLAQKDKNACEFARDNSKNDSEIWIRYLKEFPKGACAEEAKEAISRYKEKKTKETEQELYKKAKKRNKRAAWEEYLRQFPKGEHAFEAKAINDKMKDEKIGNLEWSARSNISMNFKNALNYCKTLPNKGNKKWRLPNIDELRTLIEDRETETGGDCKVSEKNECLKGGEENGCWTWEDCAEACKDRNWNACLRYDDGRYSKFGDETVWLWSSSTPQKDSPYAWGVYFADGHIGFYSKSGSIYVRCVR